MRSKWHIYIPKLTKCEFLISDRQTTPCKKANLLPITNAESSLLKWYINAARNELKQSLSMYLHQPQNWSNVFAFSFIYLYWHDVICNSSWSVGLAFACAWFETGLNTLWARQNGRHIPNNIFKCISLNILIAIKISPKSVLKGSTQNIQALV